MKEIRIVSNPYEKNISYKIKENDSWKDLNIENYPDSKLIGDKFRIKFFPFIVKDILDEIIREFDNSTEQIAIEFEGTTDEFKELESLCTDNQYKGRIIISKSKFRLENARDILPNIIECFKQMNPLIISAVGDNKGIQTEIREFTEASNDIIPICILGNYSAGKSTFINALIGNEVLPSGGEPITAKVFKINKSKYKDRAFIKFTFDNEPFQIDFTDEGYTFNVSKNKNELLSLLEEKMGELDSKKTTLIINKALEMINGFDKKDEQRVADLIEISIPFVGGIWNQINNDFVIFDTPGSNSSSNKRHLEVLKNAMKGLTNGLPIFVSEYNTLDSNDNEELNKEIQNIEELDNRFTMIVVNKADNSEITKTSLVGEDKDKILDQAIPKSLYNEGIFFVSSIVGLGSKINGEFIDDFSAEIYDDQKHKYNDKESRYYKTLYKYNIMPEQLMKRAEEECINNTNLIYTNSGLFSIEKEIEVFAEKYSAYNKSMQSVTFLDKVIDLTNDEIVLKKEEREKSREARKLSLEKDKQLLVEKLNDKFHEINVKYDEEYPAYMNNYHDDVSLYITDDELEDEDIKITNTHMEKDKYDQSKDDVENRIDDRIQNTKNNFYETIKGKKKESIYKLKDTFVDAIKDSYNDISTLIESKKDIQKDASEELLETNKAKYSNAVSFIKNELEEESKKYWDSKSQDLRVSLRTVINGATALTENKREELSKIITTYKDIQFNDHADILFDKDRFAYKFILGELKIINTTKLSRRKLLRTYNKGIKETIDYLYSIISENHNTSFDEWAQNLLDEVLNNIVELSPELMAQANIISEDTKNIADLALKQNSLNGYAVQIKEMMEWKEN